MPDQLTADEKAWGDVLLQNGGARQPSTYGEIWDANWKRGGLDTLGGLNKLQNDERDRLKAAIQTELGTPPIEEYARNRGIRIAQPSFDKQVKALNDIADTLDPEQQERIKHFRDVRQRAARAASKIDDDAAAVDNTSYGVSGWVVGGLAGMASQAADPYTAATSFLGGGAIGKGILRHTVGGAAGNILGTLATDPSVTAQREQLGLETGLERSVTNLAVAGVIGGAIGAAPQAVRAGWHAGMGPLSQRLATFSERLREDPLLAAKTPYDADTVATVATAVRRDEVTGPAPGKNAVEHETMVTGAKEAANNRGSLHDDGTVVVDTDTPRAQPVESKAPAQPAKPAALTPEDEAAIARNAGTPKAAAALAEARARRLAAEAGTPLPEGVDSGVPDFVAANRKSTIEAFRGTAKEAQVIALAQQGKVAKEIAEATGLDVDTVRVLRDNAGIAALGPQTGMIMGGVSPTEAPAAPAPPARVPEDFLLLRDDISASDYSARMSELRSEKPRPIEKLWKDPTKADPERLAAAKQAIKDWNKEYNKVSQNQKKALARDNAAFAARQAEQAKITVADPVQEQQMRSTIEERGDMEFMADDSGKPMKLSEALKKAQDDGVALSELRGCIEGNKG